MLRYLNLESQESAFSRAVFCRSVNSFRGAGFSFSIWYSIQPRQISGGLQREWYIVAAKEYMSLRGCDFPVRNCSGAENRDASDGWSAVAFAKTPLIHRVISKFAIFGEPSRVIIMFSG